MGDEIEGVEGKEMYLYPALSAIIVIQEEFHAGRYSHPF